jgi:hypothetical protein
MLTALIAATLPVQHNNIFIVIRYISSFSRWTPENPNNSNLLEPSSCCPYGSRGILWLERDTSYYRDCDRASTAYTPSFDVYKDFDDLMGNFLDLAA